MAPRANITLSDAIEEYYISLNSPSSVELAEWMFESYAKEFLEEECHLLYVDDIDVTHCRRFARNLKQQTDTGDDLKKTSAHTLYGYFSGWLDFCTKEGWIDNNPAQKSKAQEELPEIKSNRKTQQFWDDTDRKEILSAVNERAKLNVDQLDGNGWAIAFRDRAALYLISYSAARVSEIMKRSNDSERTGIKWADVDFKNNSITVLGKSRNLEQLQVPSQAITFLGEYKEILQPVNDQWPVFPTSSRSTLSIAARNQLEEMGMSEERIESIFDKTVYEIYREQELTPPSLTDDGFRKVLDRISQEYGLTIDGESPEFHGARRGLGDKVYRNNPVLAQQMLRHRNLDTTKEAYSHIEAKEIAEKVSDLIDGEETDSGDGFASETGD